MARSMLSNWRPSGDRACSAWADRARISLGQSLMHLLQVTPKNATHISNGSDSHLHSSHGAC